MQNGEHTASIISKRNVLNDGFADDTDLQDFRYMGYTNTACQRSSTYNFVSDSRRTKRHYYESKSDQISTYKKAKVNSCIGSTSTIP